MNTNVLTVSIGRRVQDPLCELVKIDPKHIGIGTYQVGLLPSFCVDCCNYSFDMRLEAGGDATWLAVRSLLLKFKRVLVCISVND